MSVGVCAIFRDEAPYLREWVAFHRLQGVERFYLYDNDSTDDWREQIPDLIYDVTPWPGKVRQLDAYNDCLRIATGVDWIAFIDIDEFLFHEYGYPLDEVLAPIRGAKVEVKWKMFGDGGHRTPPDGLTIDSFLRCQVGTHDACKTLLRAGTKARPITPHTFNGGGEPLFVPGLHLNHYWTRSVEECKAKFARGRADIKDTQRAWSEFEETRAAYNESVDITATSLFGHHLRKALNGAP